MRNAPRVTPVSVSPTRNRITAAPALAGLAGPAGTSGLAVVASLYG
ncbi:hypothetical protein ACFYY8_39985 [Streptosporangium sp. NPDC001559]